MNRRELLLLSATGLWAAPPAKDLVRVRPTSGELAGTTVYTNSWAILIGINRYPKMKKNVDLTLSEKDARDLRDLLVRSYGFPPGNITLLLGAQATKRRIEDALSALGDGGRIAETDRVLVYFSGHGQTVKLSTGGEMGFLIPSDASVALDRPEDRSGYSRTCLDMNSIWRYFDLCPARHRLFIADACYSGLLLQSKALPGEKPSGKVLKGMLEIPAIQGMSAGAKGEVAREDPRLGNSVFTSKLLEKLRFAAVTPDEVVLASELGAALKVSVANASDDRQHPQFGAFGGTEGEFLFVSTEPRGSVVPVVTKPKPRPTPLPAVVKPTPKPVPHPAPRGKVKFARAATKARSAGFPMLAEYLEEMCAIPGGTFQMGSNDGRGNEQPIHSVTLSPYYLGKTPVTVALWKEYSAAKLGGKMPDLPTYGKIWKGGWNSVLDHPIVRVSWDDCVKFCAWASSVSGVQLSLPTEAQWERAARGGKVGLAYAWGDSMDDSKCWYEKTCGDAGTASVKRRKNVYLNHPFGLIDIVGNVYQWCSDRSGDYKPSTVKNPTGPSSGDYRVVRGGSWACGAGICLRCANRQGFLPTVRNTNFGFLLSASRQS